MVIDFETKYPQALTPHPFYLSHRSAHTNRHTCCAAADTTPLERGTVSIVRPHIAL